MKTGRRSGTDRATPWLAAALLCVLAGHAPAHGSGPGGHETLESLPNNQLTGSFPAASTNPGTSSPIFVPVLLTASGQNDSFFTSEMTLTNRGGEEAILHYTYTAHRGGGSGTATDRLAPGQQRIKPDAIGYLIDLGLPIPSSGHRLGTLRVEVSGSSEFGVSVRTTTSVPEGRAGLAYPGIAASAGFAEAVYLCGLRQNTQDRSNVAFQNMGTEEQETITLRTTVFSGEPSDLTPQVLEDVTLPPGGFYQYNGILKEAGVDNGYVRVDRVNGTAPFYAYGVINDNFNSDGSFVFPVTASSLMGARGQTLPVVVEMGTFTSELMVTNFSEEAKTLLFRFVADGIRTPDQTARFRMTIEAGQQRVIPDILHTELRQKGVAGMGATRGGLAGALFASVTGGDMSGIVIGARTSASDGRNGQYGVFYKAVPDGQRFTKSVWVDGLQQDTENRSNLALVNTGEVDPSPSVFQLDIYDGTTGMLANTVTGLTVAARGWRQINGILGKYAPSSTQGYVRIRKIFGNNPFLAYGVVNDGGEPGERSGDGAYLPAREAIHDPGAGEMTDREVLEVLYYATGGPGWTNRTRWLSAAPLSAWYGVTTDGSGRVTTLELGSNQLSGGIPPELGALTQLQVLNLRGNELSGGIPPELGSLIQLQRLSLKGNQLSGAIPKHLQQLSELTLLDIRETDVCVLADAAFRAWLNTIPRFFSSGLVCDGTRRVLFSASSYEVTEGEAATVSVRLIDQTGDPVRSVAVALTATPGGGATASDYYGVPARVTVMAPLNEAVFVVKAVKDDPFDPSETFVLGFRRPLPSGVTAGDPDTATVTIRDPGSAAVTDREVLEALYHATGGAQWSDRTDWLSEAPLSGWHGVTTDENGRVRSLSLSDNGLSGTIPLSLGQLARLQALNLRANQLNGRLPPELGGLTQLQALDLGGNHLSGTIPLELTRLTHLQELDLGINQLSGEIPPELGGLTQLQALDLGRNHLSGTIPLELTRRTHLQELDLGINQLSGEIPPELGGLTQLQALNLGDNQLNGRIPPSLGDLTQLQALDLGGNHLSGTIPLELTRLIHLQDLRLGINQLSGEIPPELGGLTHLQELNLGFNQLSGTIPLELTRLIHLQDLRLGYNQLSGEIPPELGGLTHLQKLNLGSNQLSGEIPPELGSLTQLLGLDLRSNRLSGEIPPELGGLTQLLGMDLDFNQLSGAIPPELGGLTQLLRLGLGGNELSGEIPPELTQLTNLRGLYLGFNPALTGVLPQELQQLPLSTLDLMATSVCVSQDGELQQWLARIEFVSSGLNCGQPAPAISPIDILVVYTPAARRLVGGTEEIEAVIDLMFAETNQTYLDSGVNQRLVLVATKEVEYAESGSSSRDLGRLDDPSDGYMDEVHAIRDRVGADLVHFIVGVGNVLGTARLPGAFALTWAKGGSMTFAHELGHNMGLHHDRYVDGGEGLLPYSYGYVNQQAFAAGAPESARWMTIMAYPNQCNDARIGCDAIMSFSNANQTYLGDPLGVPGDERTTAVNGPADAVRTLNLTRHSVAGFRPRAPENRLTMPATLSQARPMIRTGWLAVPVSGDLFRALAPNQRGAASQQAGGVLDRATLRRRQVSVDIERLARVPGDGSTTLRLNLFEDVVLLGIIQRRTPTYSGGFALSGRLAGVPGGTVTLVANESVVAGTVRIPGATYRIRPAGPGRQEIMQIDPSQLPQGCEPVRQTPGRER